MRRTLLLSLAMAAATLLASCTGGGGSPTATSTGGGQSRTTPTPAPTSEPYAAPHVRPGPAQERIFFTASHVDQAPLDFQAGKLDYYVFSLKTAAARELRNNPRVRLEQAPATSISLILNPAPARTTGDLNPFSIKEVRQAVQYLVNRDAIAADIYQGQALPMLTHLSPTDYDFLTVFEQARGADIRYDPELARQRIKDAMTKAGATLVNNVWTYQGKSIRLKFIIRIEDERRDIGNLVMAELKAAGFDVAPAFKPFAEAVLTVYSTDPQSFEWHIYTEGWSRSAPSRYDYSSINSFAAPWLGNMPGWQETGFWQYTNDDLDAIGKRLFTGDFNDQPERDDLYRRMTASALDESVRVWVITAMNSYPLNPAMKGVTTDPVAGPRNARTLRNAYIPGKEESGFTVGNLWVWTERTIWNPVGGFGDAYSTEIMSNLVDPPIWSDPFSGLPQPHRATYTVETAGPRGKLAVPADAVAWDAAKDTWVAVGAGKQATSKVVLDYSKYLNSNWHHGAQITMADVVYPIAQAFEMAYDPNKSKIETALGVTTRPLLDTYRGFRLAEGNKLEVYVDFWHFEQGQIAAYASPAGLVMPWEVLAAMDDIVFTQRRGAYSDTAAARFGVSWLSLVMPTDAGAVNRTLRAMDTQASVPSGVFVFGNASLVSPQEAQARYKAASDWFQKYNHLVVSQGPFFLAKYDPPAQFAEIQANRDPSYPYKPGDTYLGRSPSLAISDVQTGTVTVGKAADVTASVKGPGKLGVRYVLIDPAKGRVVQSGEAAPGTSAGNFKVTLTQEALSGVQPGLYHLYLAAYSDQLATLQERKVDLDVRR